VKNNRHEGQNDLVLDIARHGHQVLDMSLPNYSWFALIRPNAQEVLPGWKIYYALTTGGLPGSAFGGTARTCGYRLMLVSESITLVTDEIGLIYHAPTLATLPDISKLSEAPAFPGAVHTSEPLKLPTSFLDRVKDFFRPTTVLASSCCQLPNTCAQNGCSSCDCMLNCDNCTDCAATLPLDCDCYWFLNVNCSSCRGQSCAYFVIGCGSRGFCLGGCKSAATGFAKHFGVVPSGVCGCGNPSC
jgi:hypothetical protein